jgi:predicted metal-binding membrane protein
MDLTAIPRDRTTMAAAAALAASTALAWLGFARSSHAMDAAGYLSGWTLMMAAMMLPSVAPLVLLYRGRRVLLIAGYLIVWAAIGLLPFAAMEWTMMWDTARVAPIVLAVAGLYELAPLKHACLRHCRHPATFLMQRYRSGALRLGVEHGLWCLGCCLGLMAVVVLAASMHLLWAAVIAAVIFVQKVLPFGEMWTRLTGVALLAAAIVVAL